MTVLSRQMRVVEGLGRGVKLSPIRAFRHRLFSVSAAA